MGLLFWTVQNVAVTFQVLFHLGFLHFHHSTDSVLTTPFPHKRTRGFTREQVERKWLFICIRLDNLSALYPINTKASAAKQRIRDMNI